LRRRFLVEVEVSDEAEGAALETLMQLASALEKMQKDKLIEDYGLALEHDATWFVKTAAEAVAYVEEAGKDEG